MTEFFTPSIVASFTAIVISLITLFQFFKNQDYQNRQFNDSINRDLTKKLYDLRLEYYPEAYDISDRIYKEKGGTYKVDEIEKALDELISWKQGVVNLIISVETRDSYYSLRDSLMKKPANSVLYSEEQIEKISNLNRNFRKQLRRDLGFLYREEKNRRLKASR